MSNATDDAFGGGVRPRLHICRPNPVECGVCHGDGTGSQLDRAISRVAKPQDRPEAGKVYALTGRADEAAISNGDSWAASVVDPQTGRSAMVFRPDDEFRAWWVLGGMEKIADELHSPVMREMVKRAAEAGFHAGVGALGAAAERFKEARS